MCGQQQAFCCSMCSFMPFQTSACLSAGWKSWQCNMLHVARLLSLLAHASMLPHTRGEGSRRRKSSLNKEHRRSGCACDQPGHAVIMTEAVVHLYIAASAASLLRSGAWAGNAQLAHTCLSWHLSLAFLWESAKDPMQGMLKASGTRKTFARREQCVGTMCRGSRG